MFPSKKLIALILLAATVVPIPSVIALTVTQAVNSLQATDPALPSGVTNPKGNIGYILANIFWGSGVNNGKIMSQYIDYPGISAWTQSGADVFYSGTGNVGIGTTSPTAKLDINGIGLMNILRIDSDRLAPSTRFFSVSSFGQDGVIRMNPGSNSTIFINREVGVARDLQVWNGNLTPILITQWSTGNVGIGTVAPNSILHLYRDTGNNAELDIQSASGAGNHWAVYNDRTTNALRFWRGSDVMTVTNGGNVGIGTTSPGGPLEVRRDSPSMVQTLILRNNDSTGAGGTQILGVTQNSSAVDDPIGGIQFLKSGTWTQSNWSLAKGDIVFLTQDGPKNNSLNLEEKMRIMYNGNVGIGTSDVSGYKLRVKVATDHHFLVGDGVAIGGVQLSTLNDANSANMPLEFTASKFNFAIGNVGIGTTSPSQRLDLGGGNISMGFENINNVVIASNVWSHTSPDWVQICSSANKYVIGGNCWNNCDNYAIPTYYAGSTITAWNSNAGTCNIYCSATCANIR